MNSSNNLVRKSPTIVQWLLLIVTIMQRTAWFIISIKKSSYTITNKLEDCTVSSFSISLYKDGETVSGVTVEQQDKFLQHIGLDDRRKEKQRYRAPHFCKSRASARNVVYKPFFCWLRGLCLVFSIQWAHSSL